MEKIAESNSERREFFRITDRVFLNYTLLSDDEVTSLIPAINNPIQCDGSNVKQRLQTIQGNINHLIEQINQSDRDIARTLRLLDEKISLIAQSVYQQHSHTDQRQAVDANLSGGGIAFFSSQQHQTKSSYEISIEFQSSGSVIRAIANVIACDKIASAATESPYLLRLVFSHMSEPDRNTLIKHMLSRQALNLRMDKA